MPTGPRWRRSTASCWGSGPRSRRSRPGPGIAIVPGTCEWFHTRLLKVSTQFIWVLGPPGCGKSTLAASLAALPDIYPTITVHSFLSRPESTGRVSRIIRGWVTQLLARDELLVLGNAVKIFQSSHLPTASTSELSVLVRNISEVTDGLRLIIDSFDENSMTERHEIFYMLAQLGSSVSVIFFSRDTAVLEAAWMNNTSIIRLSTDDTSPDVDKVITRDVTALFPTDGELGPVLAPKIISAVSRKAAGLHIYARLLLDTMNTQTTVTEVVAAVEEYPTTLEKLYANIAAGMDPLSAYQRKRVYRILQLVVCGRTPLTAAALGEAISIEHGMQTLDADQMVMNSADLVRLCRPFLQMHDSTGFVTVTHASVRDFFLKKQNNNHTRDGEGTTIRFLPSDGLSETQSHATIASACLTYLTLERCISNRFLGYAARHWSHHLAQCGPGPWTKDLVEQLAFFLRSSETRKLFSWVKSASTLEGRQWGAYLLECQADLQRFLASVPHDGAAKPVKKLLESSLVGVYADFVSATEKEHGAAPHPETVAARQSLAVVYAWMGQTERCIQILEGLLLAASGSKQQENDNTTTSNSKICVARPPEILLELGSAYLSRRRFDEATALFQEALDNRKAENGEQDPLCLKAQDCLARVYQSQGKFALAEKMYVHSLALRTAVVTDRRNKETLVVASNLGLLYKAQKRWDEAEKLLRMVLSSHEALYGDEHPASVWSAHHLGSVLVMRGSNEVQSEGIALSRRACEGLKLLVGKENNQTLAASVVIARYEMEHGQVAQAIDILEFARKVRERREGAETYQVREIQGLLALAYYRLGRLGEAVALKEGMVRVQKRRGFGGPVAIRESRDELASWRAEYAETRLWCRFGEYHPWLGRGVLVSVLVAVVALYLGYYRM